MSAKYVSTADARQEALLTSLAKLEVRLRDLARRARASADDSRRAGHHASRAYFSGAADAYYDSASLVAEQYSTCVRVAGDPAIGNANVR